MGIDTWSFAYDGLDRRVRERKNGALTKQWIWCGTRMCEERSPNGAVTRRYHAHGEQRLGDWDAGGYFHTTDHLGSIRDVTNVSGAVVAKYDYDPYGRRTKITGATTHTCDFGFTGHHTHAGTGLVLTLYRAYDPETGMWLSPDPLGESVNHYGNLYAYGPNRPFSGYDPLGLHFGDWLADRVLSLPGTQRFFEGQAAENIKNFNAGFSNNWLFGVPDLLGMHNSADPCSKSYNAGNITSTGLGLATGIAGISKSITRSSASGLYEAGSRTLPTSVYNRIRHISDPVARGRAYVDSTTRMQRALHRIGGIPSYLRTIRTGLTPAARDGLRDVIAAGYGIGVSAGGIARHLGGCH